MEFGLEKRIRVSLDFGKVHRKHHIEKMENEIKDR
jgi:hypothetical protein